jgi:hypothetical protein
MSFLIRAAVAAASRKTPRGAPALVQPVVLSKTFTKTNAIVTSHTVNMPADTDTGDLLLCFFALNPVVSSPTITTPSGWTLISQNGSDPVSWCAWKESDGSEGGGSINISTGSAGHGIGLIVRIQKNTYDNTKIPEIPSGAIPSWGIGSTLWLAHASIDRDPSVTAYPLTGNQEAQSTTTGSSTDRITQAICTQIMEEEDANSYAASPNYTKITVRVAVAPLDAYIPSMSFTESYPDCAIGDAYNLIFPSQYPVVSNGTPPYTFSIESGSLPPDFSLFNASNGGISGYGTTEGDYTFTLRCTDDAAQVFDRSVTISVAVVLPIQASGSYGTAGTVGEDFFESIVYSKGRPPYTFTIESGTLPSGLSIDSTAGSIYGLPLVDGTTGGVTVRCTDDDGNYLDVVTDSFVIDKQPLAVDDVNYPDGTLGEDYYGYAYFHAGQPPYTFSKFSGTLPPGVPLDTGTGEIYGTPSSVGTYSFVIRCTDDDGNHIDVSATVHITA